MYTVLIVLLVLLLVGALPPIQIVPHQYGYAPSSLLAVVVVVLLILLLMGRL